MKSGVFPPLISYAAGESSRSASGDSWSGEAIGCPLSAKKAKKGIFLLPCRQSIRQAMRKKDEKD